MYRTPHKVLWLAVLLLIVASCSSQLRMVEDEDDYVIKLRKEYLAAHPDGEFNNYITRGEVVKGMDFLAVLASWGHPERRQKKSEATEFWTYVDLDQASKDWIEFQLEFSNNVLTGWDLSHHFAQGGSLTVAPNRSEPLSRSSTRGKRVPGDF